MREWARYLLGEGPPPCIPIKTLNEFKEHDNEEV